MSHFTKMSVRFRNLSAIARSFALMGGELIVHEHPRQVRNQWGNTASSQYHVKFPGCPSDLFLQKSDDGDYTLHGDFFDITLRVPCPFSPSGRYSQRSFEQALALNYARAEAEGRGSVFEGQIAQADDGSLRLKGKMTRKKAGVKLSQ